jgi:SAM-dependent methyltransferase
VIGSAGSDVAARVLRGGALSEEAATDAACELTSSYEERFRRSIEEGQSFYEAMSCLQEAAHERRMALLDDLPVGDLAGKVCVDFGVGSWGFACVYPRLQRCGFAVGIDISAEAVRESARLSASGSFPYGLRYAYLTSSGDDIQLQDSSVDVFFAGECIEHVENTDAFLDEVHRVLRPGGLFIFTTPNADAYLYRVRGERWCVGPEHVALMSLEELYGYLDERFDVLTMKGFAPSIHHTIDDDVRSPAFARSWVNQFVDDPQFAGGLVGLARRRDGFRPARYEQERFHHQHPSIEYHGTWQVAALHENLTGRLAPDAGSAALEVTTAGTDVLVFLWTHDWSGIAEVSVDGVAREVDLYAPLGGFLRLHFSGLDDGSHRLLIRGLGKRNARSHAGQVIFHQAIGYRRFNARPTL